jgi:hypothetical protein
LALPLGHQLTATVNASFVALFRREVGQIGNPGIAFQPVIEAMAGVAYTF